MRKKWKIAAIVLSAALIMCACATKANEGEEQENTVNKTEKKEKEHQGNLDMISPSAYGNVEGLNLEPGSYISVIGKSSDGQFWKQVQEGAEQAVKDINDMLGYEGSDKIKVVYSGPGTADDVDEQVNILDEELARYPAAVGISIIDSKSCDVQFDLATENNIPIVSYDSASNYQGIMAKISTNNTEAAAEAARNMAEEMGNQGDIVIFVHDSKSVTSKERMDGFVQEIETNHPDMKIANSYYLDDLESIKKKIVEEINAGTYRLDGLEAPSVNPAEDSSEEISTESITDENVMDYIFEKNPDMKGIYATNGEAVITALTNCEMQEKQDVVIAGFDGDKEELEALKDGKVAGLVVQNPYGMGYATVVAAARSVLEMGNEAEIDSGFIWVTEDNVDKKAVKKVLY